MKKLIASIVFILFTFSLIYAQDVIIKKDGSKMEVIIKEVGDKTIKYVEPKDPNGIIFTIDKALIKEIKFSYGKQIAVKNPETNEGYYADDKINNFTLNFIAIGGNTLALGYERAIKPGQSLFTEAKIYGAGIKAANEKSRSGFGLDLAYRLKVKSLFNTNDYRPKHILHGSYFSPVLGFSSGTFEYDDNSYNNYKHSIFHFGLQYGKQWILQNTMSIDASIGFHYYGGNAEQNEKNFEPVRLGNMIGNQNKLFSFNLRIGFLAGKKGLPKNK
ncbi:MAG TPA: DUF3575 domain-containing protein [Flavobacteriia bacterium]|nr:DUF3575 domain-containing protein [Flavobacteriia bacterium]